MADTKDTVRTDIEINAKSAIASLKLLYSKVEGNANKIKEFGSYLINNSAAYNAGPLKLLDTFEKLNKQTSLFGNTGGQNLFNETRGYIKDAQKGDMFRTNSEGVVTAIRDTNGAMVQLDKSTAKVGDSGKKTGQTLQEAFHKTVSAVNILRIAMGAFISMLLFQATQAIGTFFRESINQAKQLEETMYRLANAERILSNSGQEVSLKGLEEGITRIKKLLPIFSREDIAQLVGQVALGTQQLGYTEKQILDLTQAILLLNIQSTKQEDAATTAGHVMAAILGKSSQGIAQLGVSFNETEKQAAALDLQLIKQGESTEKLTDNELAAVKLAIVMKNANVDNAEAMALLNDFLGTNTSKLQQNAAAWKDLQTVFGQIVNNFLPDFVPAIEKIQKALELRGVQGLFGKQRGEVGKGFAWMDSAIWAKISTGIKLTTKEYERLKSVLATLDDKEILKIFPDPSAIKDRFTRELIQSLVEVKDTATGMPDPLIPNVVDEEALKALEDLEQGIQDILLDAQHAQEDLDVKLKQKQEDLETEYVRKAEDAATDHAQKLADINQDTLDKVEDAKRKAREEEEKREQDLLQKLKELRERYLLDLEDALHERDARQVLRLMKEYDLDKKNILDRAALDEKQKKDDLAADLRNIEEDRKRKIESENIEYQRKLADLATAKAREQEELAIWYQREQEDIKRNIEQKLESLLQGYISEETLHEEHQGKIYAILAKYFGKDMALMGNLTAFMAQQFAQVGALAQQMAAIGSLNYGLGLANKSNPFQGQYETPKMPAYNYSASSPTHYAKGGQFVATRPTTIGVGEGGMPELVSVIPLSKLLGGSMGVNGSGGGGSNSSIEVAVTLSPDLEARVVSKALDGTADVISRVQRSK